MKWFFAVFFSFSFVFLAIFGVNCVYGYFFPMRFQDEISSACEKFDVDEAVVYSVINVESHFNQNAVSQKGAIGLMQVMPSTASELATALNLSEFDLASPQDNITFGTYYISELSKKFENLETALAAYNAGPTNVSGWLKNADYSDDGKTLKEIPFAETKNYLEKFRQNYNYYKTKIK